MIAPTILQTDHDRTIAIVDSLIVLVAQKPASAEDVRFIGRELRALIPGHPKGVGYVHVIDTRPGETRRVPEDTRSAFVELARTAPPEAGCVAVVLLAEGFVAAAMRGVVAAVLAALRTTLPLKVFSSIDEATRWVEGIHRDAGAPIAPAHEIARAIESLRRPA